MSHRFFILLLLFELGILLKAQRRRNEARPHSHPYILSLQVRVKYFEWSEHFCAGSLLTRNRVLTSAHCLYHWYIKVDFFNMVVLEAVAGIHDLYAENEPYKQVREIDVNKQDLNKPYSHTIYHDIAIAYLKAPFQLDKRYIWTIRFPYNQYWNYKYFDINYNNLLIIGWGRHDFLDHHTLYPFPLPDPYLKERAVHRIPYEQCFRPEVRHWYWDICTASYVVDNKPDLECIRDTGGPLLAWLKQRFWQRRRRVVIGVLVVQGGSCDGNAAYHPRYW